MWTVIKGMFDRLFWVKITASPALGYFSYPYPEPDFVPGAKSRRTQIWGPVPIEPEFLFRPRH